MRIRFGISILSFFVFLSVLLWSCDPCKDVTCKHGQPEEQDNDECICDCDKGYEGEQCGKASNKKVLGDYKAYDTCDTYVYGHRGKIEQLNNSPHRITITNFASLTVEVEGSVDHDTIIIPEQDAGDYHFHKSKGEMINSSEFVLPYSYTSEESDGDTCTALYQLQ